ncbi:hypothetical protein AYJ54_36365 [Bradyrhizobium centrolobii]|uniref:Uncharacterized protein n=1 Tax=Bradyrhizobium centrolobii TaxID=1505087 RepID=A0A176Y8S5_9BRAD|nr:hypothetical protein AYJ54_36365 [Bradyrhizobium centrolobii]
MWPIMATYGQTNHSPSVRDLGAGCEARNDGTGGRPSFKFTHGVKQPPAFPPQKSINLLFVVSRQGHDFYVARHDRNSSFRCGGGSPKLVGDLGLTDAQDAHQLASA